jgi:hypothetical protein
LSADALVVSAQAPGGPGDAVQGQVPFLESLVSQICRDYGAAPEVVGWHAANIVRQFANARVHSFIPVLVEKQLRERFRRGLRADVRRGAAEETT